MTTATQGACRLAHWGLIRAEGADAASFLQGQLTQSVTDLSTAQVRLGGYCSAKGRLMANFVLLREGPESFALLLPRELVPGLVKRLSMFVLRAKAKLRDASDETALHGLLGAAVPAELPVWGVANGVIRLPDALGQRRALCLGEPAESTCLASQDWAWFEVHAGLPWVSAGTTEHFVPQMINWELLGGVNFQKGCYPGQEVVARSQYRGTVKRRTQLLHSLGGALPAAGAEVFAGPEREQPVGEVVMAAQGTTQGPEQLALLAELQLSAWESAAELQLADGRVLRRAALPYVIKAPE